MIEIVFQRMMLITNLMILLIIMDMAAGELTLRMVLT